MVLSRPTGIKVSVTLGAIALLASACTSVSETSTAATTTPQLPAVSTPEIEIDGSSTVFPITEAVLQAFQQTEKGRDTQVSSNFSGTGGGFEKFCEGTTDINPESVLLNFLSPSMP